AYGCESASRGAGHHGHGYLHRSDSLIVPEASESRCSGGNVEKSRHCAPDAIDPRPPSALLRGRHDKVIAAHCSGFATETDCHYGLMSKWLPRGQTPWAQSSSAVRSRVRSTRATSKSMKPVSAA